MSEYGIDWDNGEDNYESNEEKDELENKKIKSKERREDRDRFKENENFFEEFIDFAPNDETEEIFKDYNSFEPNEENERIVNKFDNFNKNFKIQVKPSQKLKVKEFDKKLNITAFPNKSRNSICEEIYRNLNENKTITNSKIVEAIIKDLNDNERVKKWIHNLPADELKELRNIFDNTTNKEELQDSLVKYLHGLSHLVKNIINLNDKEQPINFSELSRNLIKQNRGLNLTKRGLEEVISGVYNHFKNTFNDFSLERAKKKAILGTESEKESIRCLRKEFKLLNEIDGGLYGGKCSNPNCHIDFKRLPAFDFHHEDSKIKTATWTDIMHKKYNEIKNTLESQKVKPICKNCHLNENAKIFNDFKDIILARDLFTKSGNDINEIVKLKVNKFIKENNTNYTATLLKYEVMRWIKKRSVLEQVFNGKCISCGDSRLPSLQTHHTNQDLKVHKWSKISRKFSIKKLVNEFIIGEECVCLCGNCHAMVNTKNFENNIEEVLGTKYVQEVQADYNKINNAIIKHTNRIKKIKKGIVKLTVKDHLNEN